MQFIEVLSFWTVVAWHRACFVWSLLGTLPTHPWRTYLRICVWWGPFCVCWPSMYAVLLLPRTTAVELMFVVRRPHRCVGLFMHHQIVFGMSLRGHLWRLDHTCILLMMPIPASSNLCLTITVYAASPSLIAGSARTRVAPGLLFAANTSDSGSLRRGLRS